MTGVDELLNAMPDAAFIVDGSGVIRSANAAAVAVLEVDPVGLSATSLVRAPAFAQAMADAAQGMGPLSVDVDHRGLPPRQFRIEIAPLKSAGAHLVLLRDFTREQAIEKMRSDFVANASHEMRTPLASIIGGIETLQGAARNDPKAQAAFLSTMLTQAQRMKRLIDDLLTLSRIELNEHVRPNASVLLNDVARQAMTVLSDSAAAAKVAITLSGEEKVPVAGDADELLQVAQNLLENAIKYGGAGGRVEVNCYSHGGRGILSVRDFGQGIAEVHLPRLTERFYRVNTQESRQRGGTGLGLAIVKHILLRHRGKLSVTSTQGGGSTFSVSIPLAESYI